MAGHESDSSVSSSISFTHENYNTLLNAFKETREKPNRLALNRVKQLEEELLNLKTDFESLDMIYKNSSYNCSENSKVKICETYGVLQKKVNYLSKTVSKFTVGTTSLNALLGSQNCVFNKAGIGFHEGFPKKIKKFNHFFYHGNTLYALSVTCFYCLEKEHTVRKCKTRLYYLPKGLVKWVPKCTVNMNGPKINRGPTLAT